jgi:hypothetical protein
MSQNSLSEFWIAKASMVSVSIQSASPIESISSVFGVIYSIVYIYIYTIIHIYIYNIIIYI